MQSCGEVPPGICTTLRLRLLVQPEAVESVPEPAVYIPESCAVELDCTPFSCAVQGPWLPTRYRRSSYSEARLSIRIARHSLLYSSMIVSIRRGLPPCVCPPPGDVAPDSEISPVRLFQDRDLQGEISYVLLQPHILLLELI